MRGRLLRYEEEQWRDRERKVSEEVTHYHLSLVQWETLCCLLIVKFNAFLGTYILCTPHHCQGCI